jgi:hypothetical protein
MIATTAPAPIRSLTGAPVTERAARIAEYVAEQVAYHRELAQASTGTRGEIELLERVSATIVKGSERYDYYNWVVGA